MKKRFLRYFVVVAGLALASFPAAFASDGAFAVEASIPFSFHVGGELLPAGHYRVREVANEPEVLMIQGVDGHHEALFLANPDETVGPASKSQLLFDLVGHEHYLAQIRDAGLRVARDVPLPKGDQASPMRAVATAPRSGD